MKKRAHPLTSRRIAKRRPETTVAIEAQALLCHVEDWLADYHISQRSDKTIASRQGTLRKLCVYLEDHSLSQCGERELRQFFAGLRHERTGQKLRPSSVDSYHRHISTFFTWCVNEEIIESSPMGRVPRVEVPRDQIQPLTPDQVLMLVEAARLSWAPLRNQALVWLLLDTGLRVTEVCELRMSRLDMPGHNLTVIGKGNRRRTVPFGNRAARALWNYIRSQGRESDGPLFTAESGFNLDCAITRSGVLQAIRKLGHAAGIRDKRVSPHTLRHTFAVEFLRNGGNTFALQTLLGHTDLQMTQKYVLLAQADLNNQHRRYSPADHIGK